MQLNYIRAANIGCHDLSLFLFCKDMQRKKGGRIWPEALFHSGHPTRFNPSFSNANNTEE
jgi:hypothetical protein